MSDFDGLALETEKAVRMTVVHPRTKEPLLRNDGETAYIDLFGIDSPPALAHQRRMANKRLNQRTTPSARELEDERVDLYAAVTHGWLLAKFDGTPIDLPCTPDNAKKLFAHPGMRWLREQVDAFIADRGNFLPASSTA